jgi:hypothetical protein
MADELDLQRARATFPEEARLSAISTMYHLLNHYVSAVHVVDGATPKDRRITVDFLFPIGSEPFRDDVRELIITKLLKQSRLTNPVIRRRTKGEMAWDARVAVYEAQDAVGVQRSPSVEVKRLMARGVLESRLIGRRSLLDVVEQAVFDAATPGPLVELIAASDDTDEELTTIIKWLAVVADDRGRPFVHLVPDLVLAGHGRRGLLERITTQLGLPVPRMSEDDDDAAALVSLLALHDAKPVILVEGHDEISANAQAAVSELVALQQATFVLTRKSPSTDDAANRVEMDRLGFSDIEVYLRRKLGFAKDDAAERARGLFLASGGRPGLIMSALHADYEAAVLSRSDD